MLSRRVHLRVLVLILLLRALVLVPLFGCRRSDEHEHVLVPSFLLYPVNPVEIALGRHELRVCVLFAELEAPKISETSATSAASQS